MKRTEQATASYEQEDFALSAPVLEGLYFELEFASVLFGAGTLLLGFAALVAWLWPIEGPFSEDLPPLHRL